MYNQVCKVPKSDIPWQGLGCCVGYVPKQAYQENMQPTDVFNKKKKNSYHSIIHSLRNTKLDILCNLIGPKIEQGKKGY